MLDLTPLSAVLIDDDDLNHMVWKFAAAKFNIQILCFYTIDSFLSVSKTIPAFTPIYIDSNLGNNLDGCRESEKVFKLGFEKIYITTGYDKNTITIPNYIVDVIGKEPPFCRF